VTRKNNKKKKFYFFAVQPRKTDKTAHKFIFIWQKLDDVGAKKKENLERFKVITYKCK
jgi:hypothetical protein